MRVKKGYEHNDMKDSRQIIFGETSYIIVPKKIKNARSTYNSPEIYLQPFSIPDFFYISTYDAPNPQDQDDTHACKNRTTGYLRGR